MTKPRRDAAPERDHLTPGDLLSDDPDKSVDPRAIRARTQSQIGPGTCAGIRDALRGTDRDLKDVTTGYRIPYEPNTLQRHYRGRCAHAVDTPPVRYDHSDKRWRTVHGDANE